MKAEQVALEIITNNYTNTELNHIVEAIKMARAKLATTNTWSLKTGSRVKWTGKKGFQTGSVSKVNKKNCIVDADNGERWNVPASMLEAI